MVMKIPDNVAYNILKKSGIPIAKFELVSDKKNLAKKARKVGYPLVMKIDSKDIIHKSDVGGLEFVRDEKSLLVAYDNIMANARKITKKITGVIIQEFADGEELIIGAKRDAQFGPVVMFGAGGILTEAIKDVNFRIAPIDKKEARNLIEESLVWKGLDKRGVIKIDKIIDVVVKVSKLIDKKKDIDSLDLNPLFVHKNSILAADVRIMVSGKFPDVKKLAN